jgi:hypothetical protein
MKTIPLTRGKVALVDDEDYEELAQFKWYALKAPTTWYAGRYVGGGRTASKKVKMHQVILGQSGVDHRDSNGLNNQRFNLRPATQAQQLRNQRIRRDNTSGYKGVYWYRPDGKWRARVYVDGRCHHVGTFDTAEAAAAARAAVLPQYHGEFARP